MEDDDNQNDNLNSQREEYEQNNGNEPDEYGNESHNNNESELLEYNDQVEHDRLYHNDSNVADETIKKENEDNMNPIHQDNQEEGDDHFQSPKDNIEDPNNQPINNEDHILNNSQQDVQHQEQEKPFQIEEEQQTEEIEDNTKVPLKDYENAIDQMIQATCQVETTHLIGMAYHNEKTVYQRKISTMKSMIQELHSKFESELNKKDKQCMDKLFAITKRYEEMKKKEGDYVKTIKALDDINKSLKTNISSVSKEKMDLEDVIFRQEEKLSVLVGRVNQIEQLLAKKNRMIKENEAYALELIAIVEDQKKEIKNLKSKEKQDLAGMPLDNYDLQNQLRSMKKELDEKNMRIKLYESDTSAIYMKNSVNFSQGREGNHNGDNAAIDLGSNNKSFNDVFDPKNSLVNINYNGSSNYLPSINKNTSQSPPNEDTHSKARLDEFKSMMDKLLEDIN